MFTHIKPGLCRQTALSGPYVPCRFSGSSSGPPKPYGEVIMEQYESLSRLLVPDTTEAARVKAVANIKRSIYEAVRAGQSKQVASHDNDKYVVPLKSV